MSKMKSLSACLSAAALMAASPAMADITAEELWTLWQEQAAEMGQTVSAASTTAGNGLTLNGVTTYFEDGEIAVTASISQVVLTNQPDGSVSIGLPETMSYLISNPRGDERVTLNFRQSGFTGAASGSTDLLTLNYTLGEFMLDSMSLENIDDGDMPEIDAAMSMSNVVSSATYDLTDPEVLNMSGTGSLGQFSISIDAVGPPMQDSSTTAPVAVPTNPAAPSPGKAPEGGNTGGFAPANPAPQPTAPVTAGEPDGEFHASMELANAVFSAEVAFPRDAMDHLMMTETFPPGLAVSTDVTYGSFSFAMDFEDSYESFDVSASNQGGALRYALSGEALDFAFNANQVAMNLASQDLPFPVSMSAESTQAAVQMPLSQSDAPAPFSASLGYRGVEVDDSLWMMMDPSGAVPRGPATVVMDLTGTVQVFIDLLTMDPDQPLAGMPGELRSLQLNELQVAFGGAELTGMGSVEFAPGQLIPEPVGSVALSLTGANGLMDQLSAGGLIGPQEAGMARGMLGMFAIPGAAPDSYNSQIEFLPGGDITANGVSLR